MSSEQELQRQCLDYLNKQPDVFAWRNSNGAIYDQRNKLFRKKSTFELNGISDILGTMSDGRIIAIEVKKPGSKESALSNEQLVFLNKIKKMNGVCGWIQSIEDLERILEDARLAKK